MPTNPESEINRPLAAVEDLFPGYTYFLIAAAFAAFFTPIISPRVLGENAYVADLVVLPLIMGTWIVIYRKELSEAFLSSSGSGEVE